MPPGPLELLLEDDVRLRVARAGILEVLVRERHHGIGKGGALARRGRLSRRDVPRNPQLEIVLRRHTNRFGDLDAVRLLGAGRRGTPQATCELDDDDRAETNHGPSTAPEHPERPRGRAGPGMRTYGTCDRPRSGTGCARSVGGGGRGPVARRADPARHAR